nr:NADH-ubiquinone oxidoreductase 20.9 kDa subunit [Tanacetum cinerariifolium]
MVRGGLIGVMGALCMLIKTLLEDLWAFSLTTLKLLVIRNLIFYFAVVKPETFCKLVMFRCGKTMLDMIPNEVFRVVIEVETIISKMREGRLRWFGHVRRMPQQAPVRRFEALIVNGKRRRGRPKLRWEDRLKLDMKELLLSEDMTSDRNA